jgi:cysteinyl-tRNA synthetase
MKVLLEYKYIFDPAEAWSSFSQFDDAFAKMLDSMGLQANMIKNMGDEEEKIIEITKKPMVEIPKDTTKTIKQVKYDLTRKQGADGKFVTIK